MSVSPLVLPRARARILARLADYLELSKPRIATLVLVTVAVSYSAASWGQPQPWLLLHLLLGTSLIAASASAFNQYLERHLDSLMPRTAERPLAAGRLSEVETVVLAVCWLVAGCVYLTMALGTRPAVFGFLTWLLYVCVYTPLKVRTPLNTAVGAFAGALPVFIGWTAEGARLDLRAGGLFAILFLWQFPHFMAIAWLYRDQYARVGMRMLTVVDSSGWWAGWQAILAAVVLIPVSLIPVLNLPGLGGMVYGLAVSLLGIGQALCAFAFLRRRDRDSARRLLHASLIYLPSLLLLLTLVPWM
jgi:protoheme IX farnesyltransferase